MGWFSGWKWKPRNDETPAANDVWQYNTTTQQFEPGPLAFTLASGVYTPTRSSETNLDANVTTYECQYLRVGNTVTVSGSFKANPTLTATLTDFELTLPTASNLGASGDLSGVATCGYIASMVAEIDGQSANNTANIRWIATDTSEQLWSFIFTYQVI